VGVPLSWYLALSTALFIIGLYGVTTRRNGIVVLMCIELMLNAANINFIAFSAYYASEPGFDAASGQVFAVFAIAIAAAEAAVGLAIFLSLWKTRGTINVDALNVLRW
jgi:NADH-quinone oxidoreductase subunit K